MSQGMILGAKQPRIRLVGEARTNAALLGALLAAVSFPLPYRAAKGQVLVPKGRGRTCPGCRRRIEKATWPCRNHLCPEFERRVEND